MSDYADAVISLLTVSLGGAGSMPHIFIALVSAPGNLLFSDCKKQIPVPQD